MVLRHMLSFWLAPERRVGALALAAATVLALVAFAKLVAKYD